MSANLRFMLIWMAVPMLLRVALLASIGVLCFDSAAMPRVFHVVAMTLPQDLCVALQALFCIVAVRCCFSREPWTVTRTFLAGWATVVFFIVHIYLLADFLLYVKTGLRMDYSFLGFVSEARSFASSIWEVGVLSLVAGLIALLLVQILVYQRCRQSVSSLRMSWPLLASLPLVAFLAAASRDALPAELGYTMDNAVLADEMRLVTRWLNGEATLSEGRDEDALAWLDPQAEKYRRVSVKYPLLKHTEGFYGEKQFDLQVSADDRPHVVVLFLESFRAADVGALGGKHNVSPNFDRLAKDGVLFTNFYANGVQTTRAVMASLFGVLPRFSTKATQAAHSDIPLIGMADLFNQRGYTSAFITANSLSFENKQEFFKHQRFDEIIGDKDVAKKYPHVEGTSWGLHDEFLMQYLAEWLYEKDKQKQPAFVTSFTVSHHHPWHSPSHYKAPKVDTGDNEEYRRFLQTFHYTDRCLGYFIELLKHRGLYEKTILFVLADTATPQGEHHNNFMPVNHLYEENTHIPLLMLAPGRLKKPAVIDDLGSQVDLLPTVMDMFGMRGPNHAVGTSLVRRVPDRVAYFNSPFTMQYLGMRKGTDKYIFNVRSETSSLYQLDADPAELRDVASRDAARVAKYRDRVTAVNQFFLKLYLTERFVDPAMLKATPAKK